MRRARHKVLVEKAVAAAIAAIEVYNKPDSRYREESFSILMLNAWELLLKARIVKENRGDPRSIEVWEPRKRPDGTKSKRLYAIRNRSKNNMTIGLDAAINTVQGYEINSIDVVCKANLDLLKEIRDNAIHLHNTDPGLSKRMQEVGAAALKNFVHAAQTWFLVDLARYNFYLMPVSFFAPTEIIESLKAPRPVAARNLLLHIGKADIRGGASEFAISLNVELNFVRGKSAHAVEVKLSNSPDALPIALTEQQERALWPWDFSELVAQLQRRYSDFVQNARFYKLKGPLEKQDRLCRSRYLDPVRKTGAPKRFYGQAILTEFDKHYTLTSPRQ